VAFIDENKLLVFFWNREEAEERLREVEGEYVAAL